ncbi:hypothetical protein BJX99DRAFT_265265 [Aspergillus californicus]
MSPRRTASHSSGYQMQDLSPTNPQAPIAPQGDPVDSDSLDFAISHDFESDETTPFKSIRDLNDFARHAQPGLRILFLRGHLSGTWAKAVSVHAGVNIDPEITQAQVEQYCNPQLPSSSFSSITLQVPNIRHHGRSKRLCEPEDLESRRGALLTEMVSYHKNRESASDADSIVREYSILSTSAQVIYQEIKIVFTAQSSPWDAVVLLHAGAPLAKSTEGPWSSTRDAVLLPVVMQTPSDNITGINIDLATSSLLQHSALSEQLTISLSTSSKPKKAPQNLGMIALHQGTHINRQWIQQYPFYILNELFHFSSSAGTQLLNCLQSHIKQETMLLADREYEVEKSGDISIRNLKYLKQQVQKYDQALERPAIFLVEQLRCLRGKVQGPGEHAITMRLKDIEYLQEKAGAIKAECQLGLEDLDRLITASEAKVTSKQGRYMRRMATIATCLSPISPVASLWSTTRPIGRAVFTTLGLGLVLLILFYYREVTTKLLQLPKKLSQLLNRDRTRPKDASSLV